MRESEATGATGATVVTPPHLLSPVLLWVTLLLGPVLGLLAGSLRYQRISTLLRSVSFRTFYRDFADVHDFEPLKNGLDLWMEERERAESRTNTSRSLFTKEAFRRNLEKLDEKGIRSRLEEWLHQRSRTERTSALRTVTLLIASTWILTTLWQWNAATSLYAPWTARITSAIATLPANNAPLAAIRFTSLRITAIPPSYTGLSSSSITYPDAVLSTLNGSRITLSGTLSEDVVLAKWERRSSDGSTTSDTLVFRGEERKEMPDASSDTAQPHLVAQPNTSQAYPVAQPATAQPSPTPFSVRYTIRERSALVTRFDTLEFILQDSAGRENPNRFRILVHATPDLAPSASLLSPSQRLETDQVESLSLTFTARDDHGLSLAELRYALKRAFITDTLTGEYALPTPNRGEISTHFWDLRALRLRPRDELIYWIRVRDNDPLTGPKWGESLRHTLMVPSLADMADLFEESTEQVESQLETLAEEQEAFAEELEDVLRELQEGNQNTQQNRRRLNQLQEQREQVEQAVSEAREAMESLEQQMSQSDMLSEETRLAYKELQDLMQSLDSPELKQALQELQQALSQMNANQIQQAMEKLDFNEELYRKRLERTLDLFKTLNVQMQIEQMVKRYEAAAELAQKAQEAAQSDKAREASEVAKEAQEASEKSPEANSAAPEATQNQASPPPAPEAAASPETAQSSETRTSTQSPETAQMLEELSLELEKIQDLTQKLSENPPSRRKDAIQNFQSSLSQQQSATQQQLEAMLEALQQAREQLEEALKEKLAAQGAGDGQNHAGKNNPENSSQSAVQSQPAQQSASQSPSGSQPSPTSLAQDLLSQMQQAMEFANSLNQQQARVNLQAMQQVLAGLIQLSIDQETIARETETLPSQNPLYTDLAQRQRTITTQFSALSDSLVGISKEIPGLPDVLLQRQLSLERTLTESGRQLAERAQSPARTLSRQSMAQINELALLTSDAIRQIQQQQQNGQGGGDGSSSQSSSGQGQGQGQMSLQQMIQGLQQMRGDQARLNQEMQNFVNDLQGDRLQSGQQGRQQALDQFAKRQQELRRQLQELRRQGALPSGDRLQSEMERILEQMDRAIEDLRGGRTDDLLRQRQQNILSRMLTTESSLQTRGQEEERKGREARRTPVGNTGLTTEQLLDLLRQQLDNPRYGDFTPEIKQQIEAYFSRVVNP